MNRFSMLTAAFVFPFWICASLAAEEFLIKDSQPQAEIIIAKQSPRSTRLAAHELQTYLKKISGATLEIVNEPTGKFPVQVFVGQSPHTEKLGMTNKDLKYGAYRIVSGENWMVLIGDDTDFVPKEPWARNNSDRVSGKLQREWETRTGVPYGVPSGGMYKNRARMPGELTLERDGKPVQEYLWTFDERGSYNAVCGFLRKLGVRWYLPGELGEVVPKQRSIPLPVIDETIKPDFEVRRFNIRFGVVPAETMKWAMRLGMRDPYGLMVAHGMHTMTQTKQVLENHPDWFALFGGQRDHQPDQRLNHLCYSNRELFDETVRWARAQFDVYDYESVSIMPPDAYISICQCELCQGKEVPEMGARGKLSNHVWDFVNRVAKEVGKTHPKKKILCCAYGANTLPPTNIDKLEPNVQVVIVGGRRPRNSNPEQREAIRQLRQGWLEKTDNPLMIFENYPFVDRGFYLPAFVAETIGKSINATKGISRGEDIWLSFGRDFHRDGIGFNHFQVYFTARMYWGGKDRDPLALLKEYCQLFYGPAGQQMQEFFQFCEANYQDMEHDKQKVDSALEMFAEAQASVSPDSVYAKRLGLIDEFLESLRSKAEILGQKRGPVTKLRTVWEPKEPIVIDGKLDDQYWRDCPVASRGRLRELQTGRIPTFGTTIMAGWDKRGSSLYFGIRCQERPGEKLNIATTKNEDQAIWYGDLIEIELDTDSHSYYQLAINPAGALVDLDRGAEKNSWFRWQSQAEVATHVADDHWTVEIRIPVTDDENDPLNQVIGRKPSASLPWHFNICRQRIRSNGSEYSAFSPTATASYHVPMKFAYFYDGRSHAFEVDPSVSDYLIASQKAEKLLRSRQYEQAFKEYLSVAHSKEVTEFQKSDALRHVTECARLMKDFSRAQDLATQIPIEVVSKTVQMENLLAQREFEKLLEQFGQEKLREWPFWQIGIAAFARGKAHFAEQYGQQAESDFQLALEFMPESRQRLSILRTMAFNRERVLRDKDGALEIYRRIATSQSNTGTSDYFYGLQGAASILTERRNFDEALKILDLVDPERLPGSWQGSIFLARGQTLMAAGRQQEAVKAFQAVLNSKAALKADKQAAQQAIHQLEAESPGGEGR